MFRTETNPPLLLAYSWEESIHHQDQSRLTDLSNHKIKVIYNYVPSEINDLNQGINYPSVLNDKIVCYGIASEFLASKDQFDKSEFWKNKFLFELFKFKTKKERRLKKLYYV